MRKAFTMAEVLITLGIIGVVAALTMPVILSKVEDKVLESQSLKTQNILANGMRLLMAKETSIASATGAVCPSPFQSIKNIS